LLFRVGKGSDVMYVFVISFFAILYTLLTFIFIYC